MLKPKNPYYDRRIVSICVGVVAACFAVNVGMKAYAQDVKRKEAKQKEETYTRPKPTRPIRPQIPGVNRYQQDKIFLEYADSLYKVESWRDTVERQILKGNVKFRQAGMWMYCDSAYYYPELNSLDAFGNVKMEQGDTLFVYADKLYYEGNERMARLKNGPSRAKVNLINRDVTLTTDSLDYSLAMELGWYEKWGTIDDKVNTLTSLYGEYSPGTKNADFYHDVVLVNNENNFTMLTDTLHYNTGTHLARIESATEIQGQNDTIVTTRGVYDTRLGNAELLSRSIIIHRDSNNNITTLEGDSIIYDKLTRISKAYMFRDPLKHSMPMVLTDTAHKTTLIGGFGIYNDSTREALATGYPLLMEYSQSDTLFLRADTIRTYIITQMVSASRRWTASGYPEKDGQPIIKCDSSSMWLDNVFFRLLAPLVETPLKMLIAAAPKQPEKPSDPVVATDSAAVADTDLAMDSVMVADTDVAADSVDGPTPPLVPVAPIKEMSLKDAMRKESAMAMGESVSNDSVQKDSVPKYPKDFHIALAYHRARFFKQDLQGVADSMVFVESDSMMYMYRKPIVWSGERQVTGNVEAIFLPQEADSTFNRLVAAESSFLTIELDSNKMDRLKMWPEVTGTVTPLFLVKKTQQYLPQFRWWTSLRPVREWYGGRVHWSDNLGEVPDELEQYFLAPSDFGEPKSFSGTRYVLPASSLPIADDIPAIEAPDSVAGMLPGSESLEGLEKADEELEEKASEIIKTDSEMKRDASSGNDDGRDDGSKGESNHGSMNAVSKEEEE